MDNFSILTNSGAYVALANLGGIQSALGQVQKRVSTGLQVADATDNAAVFAVAQGIRANLQQYNSVNTGLNDAQALVQTALAAATSVSNLLPQITVTLTQLADGSINDQQRLTYTASLKSQLDEIQTYINDASYNGKNLLNDQSATQPGAGATYYLSTPQPSLSVLSGIQGQSIIVNPANLIGNQFVNVDPFETTPYLATSGFLKLALLSYYAGVDYSVSGSAILFTIANSFFGSNIGTEYYYQLMDQNFGVGLFIGSDGNYVSRGTVFSNAAVAALASPSAAGNDYLVDSPFGSMYGPSIFDGAISSFTQQVNSALGSLGATANNIQLQLTFNQSIADSLTTGLGNLVDANLAQQSAQLTALQTQQQLATQSLSIANAAPQTILSLFK